MPADEDSLLKHGLELQVSLLACQAIETGDPIGFLQDQLIYHNAAEYHLHEKGPLRWMLLLSDEKAGYALAAKTSAAAASSKPKLQPTAYMVIANRVIDANTYCPAVSFANFCSGMKPCGFELAEGASVSNLVLQCLSTLPMYTLFNLLGQGYKVVLAGRQFGGVVAHALAAKLLLQVQHEIQMARKMGLDLSALSRTGDKVVSFGLEAPLFANAALHKALSDCGHSGNLHTLWRVRDASPAYLTLCGNVFASLELHGHRSSGASQGPAAAGAAAGAAGATAAPKVSRASTLLRHANAGGFKAVNRWAAVAGDEARRSGSRKVDHKLSATALDVNDLLKGSAKGGGRGDAAGHGGSGPTDGGMVRPRVSIPLARTSPSPSVGSPNASRPSPKAGVAGGGPPPGRSSLNGTAASVVGATVTSSATRASISGIGGASTPKKLVPTAAAGSARTVSVSGSGATPAAAVAAPAVASASTATAAGGGSSKASVDAVWKAALTELLAQGGASAVGEALQPVGRFWLLDRKAGSDGVNGGAAAKPSKADGTGAAAAARPSKAGGSAAASKEQHALYSIDALAHASVLPKVMGWLAASNKDLFARWEYSLEELKRDLIEVYAWSTFKTTIDVDGELADREEAMRPTRMDIM